MRRVFGSLPSDERVVKKEVRRLSKRIGVETPGIVFWSRGDALYNYQESTVYIPQLEWISVYQPDLDPERYWCLVMHEYAHHLDNVWYPDGDGGHTANYYSMLMGVVMACGLPLDIVQEEEHEYKPIGFRNGKHRAGWRLIESHKK